MIDCDDNDCDLVMILWWFGDSIDFDSLQIENATNWKCDGVSITIQSARAEVEPEVHLWCDNINGINGLSLIACVWSTTNDIDLIYLSLGVIPWLWAKRTITIVQSWYQVKRRVPVPGSLWTRIHYNCALQSSPGSLWTRIHNNSAIEMKLQRICSGIKKYCYCWRLTIDHDWHVMLSFSNF